MNYDYRVFLFRGQRKEESIQIDKAFFSLSVGQILCTILGLKDVFFRLMNEMLRDLNEIQRVYLESKGRFSDEFVARKCLEDLKTRLFGELFSDPEEALLHRLIVFLPCFDAYSKAYTPMMRVLPNSGMHGKIVHRQIGSMPDSNHAAEEFDAATRELKKNADQYAAWNSFLCFLEDDLEYPLWEMIAKTVFGANNPMESYLELMKSCLVELKRLQEDLDRCLFRNDAESAQLLNDMIPGPRVYRGKASLIGPGADEIGKYTHVYEIVSFSELVRAELLLLEQIDRTVHRCRVCGKYFVPYRNTANACQRKNPAYGGERCTVVFTNMEYPKKHPEFDTAMGKLYMKQYKAYSKWANESISFIVDNAKLIYDKKVLGKKRSDLTKEITALQDSWRENAKEALLQFYAGSINEEQCKSLITLPKIEDRSPLFAAFRKEFSRSRGID